MPVDPPRRCALLLIDVEPDARNPAPGSPGGWEGTRAALPLIAALRDRLEERTSARVCLNWFVRIDPQIESTWGRADHVRCAVPELLETIAAHGDYVGIHPHLWRWTHGRGWRNDLRDEAWMRCCLRTAVGGYEAIFGRAPEACRFGDRWLDDAAVRAMRESGIRYDLTLEPGRPAEPPFGDRGADGTLPDTRTAPRVPFAAVDGVRASPTAAGNGAQAVWIIPLTTSSPRWQPAWYPPFVVRASVRPNLALSPLLLGPHLRRELARATPAPLVLALRTGDLADRRRLANYRRNVARMLAHEGLARCRFTTPPAAVDRWLEAAPR